MNFIFLISALIVGIVIGYLIANGKLRSYTTRAEMLEKQLSETQAQHKNEIASLKEEFNNQTMTQLELMKEQLTTASEQELKSRTEDLSRLNKEQLDKILIPLNQNIEQMKKESELARQNQNATTASLNEFIETTRKEVGQLGNTTNNLVSALSYDNKYQGQFGEMQLRKLLESFGLVNGVHFEEQAIVRDDNGDALKHEETGKGMQPDVVLHFPDKRDLVIDAKTPMKAFLRFNDTTLSDVEHEQAIKDHIAAVRKQVSDLSKKSYWEHYNKVGVKIDFVVMFIPSDSAMQLAITKDQTLWSEAFDQKVFIAGPQTLFALLKVLDVSWKQMAQVDNQQKIIEYAEEIVRRVQIFRDRYENIRNTLTRIVTDEFHNLDIILADGGVSIITSAQKLIEWGVKERMPKKSKKGKRYKSLMEYGNTPLIDEDLADEETEEYDQEDDYTDESL